MSSISNVLISHQTEEHNLEAFRKIEAREVEFQQVHDDKENYIRTSIEFRGNQDYAKLPWKHDND